MRSQDAWIVKVTAFVVMFAISVPPLRAAPEPVTLQTLLGQMVDRDALARWPSPLYSSREFTSYDRRSVSPDKPGWFANHDEGNFLRAEEHEGRRELVMMDADGPGAIVCFFKASTDPAATVRIYLDESTNPVIAENLRYLLGGAAETEQEKHFPEKRVPPFPADEKTFLGGFGTLAAPFAGVQSLGCSMYLPIPYARHCKVTYDKPGKCYYRINYRTYPPSTPVETFTLINLKAAASVLDRVGRKLLDPDDSAEPAVDHFAPRTEALAPGASMSTDLTGPGAIRSIALRVKAGDAAEELHSTVISMTFDGEQTVWCPIGDFFGSGIGIHAYKDWQTAVASDGTMRCRWVAPFKTSCQIKVTNLGQAPIEATMADVGHSQWIWDDRSMHFHASWHRQYPIKTKAADGTMDWNYLEASGRGLYVGDTLIVHNGATKWWGEGDEKIYVDGETFPSHFGTGTEDYYGYSRGGRDSRFFEDPFGAHPAGRRRFFDRLLRHDTRSLTRCHPIFEPLKV